jgi:polysaccharide export outer membrane protein
MRHVLKLIPVMAILFGTSKMEGPTVPIVYSASFIDPSGYFLATQVQMHNKDVIFAANAQAVDITKFAGFLNTLIRATGKVTCCG